MRNPNVLRLAALVACVLAAACGPASKEVAAARTAHYKGDKLQIFARAKEATEQKFKIAKSDETTLGFETITRMYDPNGLAAGERASSQTADKSGYNSTYPDGSLAISYAVTLLPDGDQWVVKIKPSIAKYHAGSPQMEPLQEGDISLPGWVQGKTDQLALDIHDALKQWEVKSVPGAVPPAGPAAGSAAPAAEGSAAAGSAAAGSAQ